MRSNFTLNAVPTTSRFAFGKTTSTRRSTNCCTLAALSIARCWALRDRIKLSHSEFVQSHGFGSGTDNPRQIRAANRSATSVCRGTASTSPVAGFVHSEWDLPSRLSWQPWRRKCFSSAVRFIRRLPHRTPHLQERRASRPPGDLLESTQWRHAG